MVKGQNLKYFLLLPHLLPTNSETCNGEYQSASTPLETLVA